VKTSRDIRPVIEWLTRVDGATIEPNGSHFAVRIDGRRIATGSLNASNMNHAVDRFVIDCRRVGLLREYGERRLKDVVRERRDIPEPVPYKEEPPMNEPIKRQHGRLPTDQREQLRTYVGRDGYTVVSRRVMLAPSTIRHAMDGDPVWPSTRRKVARYLLDNGHAEPMAANPEPEPDPDPKPHPVVVAAPDVLNHPVVDRMLTAIDARDWRAVSVLADVAADMPELRP